MIFSHQGATPVVHPTAWIAPTATLCGEVVVGPHARIMHGSCVIAEGGRIEIGTQVIVLENATIRSTVQHSTRIGDYCLIGPHAHLVGCTLEAEVFIATGAAVFHEATLGRGSEVRIHGVVHLRTRLAPGATVPIGWVAVGDPAAILPPEQHEQIWALQKPLDFPLTAYGIERSAATMVKITETMSARLGLHRDDRLVTET
jgi:carbonic anhydrase/acetyltransferase-like protein (isoleucine patch superfamily)